MIDPVALLKTYHAALNDFDLTTVKSMFAEDAVYVSPGLNGQIEGRDAIMKAMESYFAEFADQVSVDESVEQASEISATANWRLKATSSLTGKSSSRHGSETIIFNYDGLIQRVEVTDRVVSQS